MDRFWNYEVEFLENFVADMKLPDLTKILDEEDKIAIEKNLKYGNLNYFSNSVVFTPQKSNPKVCELNIVLNEKSPAELVEEIFESVQLPLVVAIGENKFIKYLLLTFVDFWSIGISTKGPLVIYPSYGTRINDTRYVKTKEAVDNLVNELMSDNLEEKIFLKHSQVRPRIRSSGVNIKKAPIMWVRLAKSI